MKSETFSRLRQAQAARRPEALVTQLADGDQCLVDATDVSGELVPSTAVLAEVRRRLPAEHSGPIDCESDLTVWIYTPARRLLIVGAVHIAQALAPIATVAGFEVTVIDPRRAFASAVRFPGVMLCDEWPGPAFQRLAPDAQTAVVTLSHDPKIDDPALAAALASDAFYVGALGSRRTHDGRRARLTELGLGDQLERLRAPVGLDLGGRSAGEIAVAIAAEIIRVRYHNLPEESARRSDRTAT